jgi:hypothetical protein
MANFIYRSGTTFYLLHELPADDDFVHASYAASHMDSFGHVRSAPAPTGGSYKAHFAVIGLYQKVG